MLQRIAESEKLDIDDAVLEYIAYSAGGSFRDAAKMLELMALEKDFSLESAKKVIGHTVDHHELLRLVEAHDLQAATAWCERHRETGADFKILIASTLDELHKQLLKQNGIAIEVKNEYNFSIKSIAKLITLLQNAHAQLKYTPISSLPLELALIDFLTEETKH